MAAFLLHVGATVACVHVPPGKVQLTPSDSRVKVGGKDIVLQQFIYGVSGCGLSSSAGGPCLTAQWTSAATRVKASGIPVLFTDSQAICVPTGTGLKISSTQTRVKVT